MNDDRVTNLNVAGAEAPAHPMAAKHGQLGPCVGAVLAERGVCVGESGEGGWSVGEGGEVRGHEDHVHGAVGEDPGAWFREQVELVELCRSGARPAWRLADLVRSKVREGDRDLESRPQDALL